MTLEQRLDSDAILGAHHIDSENALVHRLASPVAGTPTAAIAIASAVVTAAGVGAKIGDAVD